MLHSKFRSPFLAEIIDITSEGQLYHLKNYVNENIIDKFFHFQILSLAYCMFLSWNVI